MRTVLTVYEDYIFFSTNITSNFQFVKTKCKQKLFLEQTIILLDLDRFLLVAQFYSHLLWKRGNTTCSFS